MVSRTSDEVLNLEFSLDTEKKYEKLILVLGILCKMFSDYYWDYAYCFTVESMPTVIRQRRDFKGIGASLI